MKLEFQYGTTNIAFNVTFKDRKTMEIAVEPPDSVTVIAPIGTKEEQILEKVKRKARWIIEQIVSFRHMNYTAIEREFVNGESFMYLGRNYALQIEVNSSAKSQKSDCLEVNLSLQQKIKMKKKLGRLWSSGTERKLRK